VTKRLDDLADGVWAQQHVEFDTDQFGTADELHFLLPAGGTLHVDDVLLYEAGG
jgi:hypothetical protein